MAWKKSKVQNVFALPVGTPKFLSRFTVQLRKCALLDVTSQCIVVSNTGYVQPVYTE